MSGYGKIDGDYRVNKGFEDYNQPKVYGQDDEFKKKLNSIHVANSLAYMPSGGIGSLLNSGNVSRPTTTAVDV